MRLLLLDWISEVTDEFGLKRETYHLAAYYVDRYLTLQFCPVNELQLLGAGSLLLASKSEEIFCPRVRDFAFATDNGFTGDAIIEMEQRILSILQFRIQPITVHYIANFICNKWDDFFNENQFEVLQEILPDDAPIFKSERYEDYRKFKSYMQAVDLLVLDLETFSYEKYDLALAAFVI